MIFSRSKNLTPCADLALTSQHHPSGIEKALKSEIGYREQIKAGLEARVSEEAAAREAAEAQLEKLRVQLFEERDARKNAEEQLRRAAAELDSLRARVDQLHQARDGACSELAAEKQQRVKAVSGRSRAEEYSRELEALYRAGLRRKEA